MDHFESIIAKLLEVEGYWVRRSFKVNLTIEERREIGRPTMPRPEIDILALKPRGNIVYAIEAKSFLDSAGVIPEELWEQNNQPQGRYKIFTCNIYRNIVLQRLRLDLDALGKV